MTLKKIFAWSVTIGAVTVAAWGCSTGPGTSTSQTGSTSGPDGGYGLPPPPPVPTGTSGSVTPPGNTTNAAGDGGACKLAVTIISTACSLCAQASCCAQINACFEDPSCKSFEQCMQDCVAPDSGVSQAADAGGALSDCVQGCVNNASAAALQEHNAWGPNCVAKNCSSDCGLQQ
jgi:hypothetical protein